MSSGKNSFFRILVLMLIIQQAYLLSCYSCTVFDLYYLGSDCLNNPKQEKYKDSCLYREFQCTTYEYLSSEYQSNITIRECTNAENCDALNKTIKDKYNGMLLHCSICKTNLRNSLAASAAAVGAGIYTLLACAFVAVLSMRQ